MRTRNHVGDPVGEHIAAAPLQLNEDVATALPLATPATATPAAPKPLNENAVKALPVPESGNRVHYFPGAIIQGKEVPRGFGVRMSSGGVRSFVMNYRIKLRERRYTIGQWPDWSVLNAVKEARVLRQRIDRSFGNRFERAVLCNRFPLV